jgi:Domain of unknown function (DUF4878)
MRSFLSIFISAILLFSLSCAGDTKPKTPFETFVAYTRAISEKDTTTMKLLLSQETIKMHEQEAKSQGVTLDEIVKRETLFTENQKQVKYRNEKIEGDKATLEVENSFGTWETVPFVKEEGAWKIDKKSFANQMIEDIEQKNNRKIDEIINQGRQP